MLDILPPYFVIYKNKASVNVNIKIAEIDNIRIANYGKENIVFNSIILLKSSISKYIGETIMERNILGELLILKHMNIKPNFSELARKYDINRHTIAKYWRNGERKQMERKPKKSILDQYIKEIERLFQKTGVHKRAAYEYLAHKYGAENIGSYSNFRHYTSNHNLKPVKTLKPHVRYETKPGQQLQVDWKENLKITTKYGEVIHFHLMTSTLGYSREHIFIYTKGKTTEDFLRCTIDTLYKLGGVPEHILTDNMTAVVSITNGTKRKHNKIRSFEKDVGMSIRLCKARTPQTKGKDESANRFISWLYAYDGEIEKEEELIALIETINGRVNNIVNQTTDSPPHILFQKEKEYLRPLPNKVLLDSYVDCVITQTVPSTLLVTYKGSGYSVPTQFINKRVKIVPIENKLYIYYNTQLITVHPLNRQKINYHPTHYQEALRQSIHNKERDIEEMATENLKRFEALENNHGN